MPLKLVYTWACARFESNETIQEAFPTLKSLRQSVGSEHCKEHNKSAAGHVQPSLKRVLHQQNVKCGKPTWYSLKGLNAIKQCYKG